MSEFLLRPSRTCDVDEMSDIEQASFSVPWSRESIRQAVTSDGVYSVCALENGKVAGYGMSLTAADEGEILNVAVSPEYRRRGLGEKILSDMLRMCAERGARTVYLEVRESNAPAASLYVKTGFTVAGRRKNYYKYPTEDAVIMVKLLPGGDDNDNSCD